MKYRIVQNVDGCFVVSTVDDAIFAAMEVRGGKFTGFNSNPRQRKELQDEPIFEGFVGPMWDGDAIRYEDAVTYEFMSR